MLASLNNLKRDEKAQVLFVDLREKVLQYLEKNKNREAASRLFQVGIARFIGGSLVKRKREY
jgi:hypothetical protein